MAYYDARRKSVSLDRSHHVYSGVYSRALARTRWPVYPGRRARTHRCHPSKLHMQSPLLFRAEKRIHKRNSLVFEGKLHVGPSVLISVVCKTVFAEFDPDRLNDEAAFYMTRLKALQGSTVPKFYGPLAGMYITAGRRKRRMACILLESWRAPFEEDE